MTDLTRRRLMAGAAACGAGLAPAVAAAPGLEILAAPTGASVVLAQLIVSGALRRTAPHSGMRLWRNTDDLRAAIVSGRARLFSTPTHVPANLAARGMKLKLLCLLGMGHLVVVTSDPAIHTLHDLAGKQLVTFFRHDMPDLVFRSLAKMEGMNPDRDVRLSYVQSGMEAGQLLMAGRTSTALLSEPMATAAIMSAGKQGRHLRRAILLNDVWARHKSRAGIPMVGLALRADLAQQAPDLIADISRHIRPAAKQIFADRAAAGRLAERMMGYPHAMFQASLDHLNIQIRSAAAAKADLLMFYQTLLDLEPQSLGGKLPPDDFYMDL